MSWSRWIGSAINAGTSLFSFHEPATREIYTLSLHDALPISLVIVLSTGGSPLDGAALSALAEVRVAWRSEEHTSELQSHSDLVCRLLLEKKNAPGIAKVRSAHAPARVPQGSPSPRFTLQKK